MALRKTLKALAWSLLALLLVLASVVTVNTLGLHSRQLAVQPVPPAPVDAAAAAQRLAGAVALRTVSSLSDPAANSEAFVALREHLRTSFPRLHASLGLELINGGSLLYTWKGSDAQAKPMALLAHQDVVPIAPGTEAAWQAEPFSGAIRDGFVWGRGAWDNKSNLLAQMEAVEALLAAGFTPSRTVYLVAGHDEEVGGLRGARQVVQTLKARGVRLGFVLDEGLVVTEGILAGLDRPAALIGLAEKGYGTFHLSLDTAPGHSSMPPPKTAIGMMSAALASLESHPRPASIGGVAAQMFDTLAPEMQGINRVFLSNLWLFRPLVQAQLEKSGSSNAMLRTTTALTVVQAGNKDNVLPGHAEATVNFRLLPGDSLEQVQAHIHRNVANQAISVKGQEGNAEPSAVSPVDTPDYQAINRSVREVFPGTIVAPGLMLAATDARHFGGISDAVYRFSPVRAREADLARFHGTNERVAIANYVEMIQFYQRLLRNAAATPTR